MTRGLVLFEDGRWPDLAPLTDLLPVPALAFGAADLASRWQRAVKSPLLGIEARPQAMALWHAAPARAASPDGGAGDLLAVNAAALPGPWLDEVSRGSGPASFMQDDRLIAARLTAAQMAPGLGRGAGFADFLAGLGLPRHDVDARVIAWPWQMIEWNSEAIAADLAGHTGDMLGDVHPTVAVYRPERVTVAAGARIDALAVLDARDGPIRIGADAIVLPHTLVIGPCAVGAGTHLLGGAVGHSTFGPGCRIAGEVDSCVWQGWANKRHHGFVGHSLIGEWANLGALTTTSDLKNNYGTIRVQTAGGEVDSGTIKLGSLIGGGVKTGIGTLLPSGGMIGTGSHLFGGGRYAPKRLPAFSWWDGARIAEYDLDKFLATARVAMSRRGRELGAAEEAAVRALFAATAAERGGPGSGHGAPAVARSARSPQP